MTSTAVPQELVRLICSFSNPATLASICLSNGAFYIDARAALYEDISFNSSHAVERFLQSARPRLKLAKRLSLIIPSFHSQELPIWEPFLVAVHRDADLIVLRISTQNLVPATQEFQHLAGNLLSIPSLKYVAVSTTVVPATVAVQCPALKEIESRFSADLDLVVSAANSQRKQPTLNTFCLGQFQVPPVVYELFNFTALTKLAVSHNATAFPTPLARTVFQLMKMTCEKLRDLSIGMPGRVNEEYIAELRTIEFPNLQTFTLLLNRGDDPDHVWSDGNLIVSTLVSNSGPHLREFRLYLHRCKPSIIVKGRESSIPRFHSQITKIRLYCWTSDKLPAEIVEVERILHECLGPGRDFQVFWSARFDSLTYFCEPRE
ncbi:hypothetical protein DL96DRAFT_1817230 [Flagelloscypha sp. PMI_526]|nr:hypothetical protein DL96DRAFT_1817230 [Flagelloscypha sp. PMI_526]